MSRIIECKIPDPKTNLLKINGWNLFRGLYHIFKIKLGLGSPADSYFITRLTISIHYHEINKGGSDETKNNSSEK